MIYKKLPQFVIIIMFSIATIALSFAGVDKQFQGISSASLELKINRPDIKSSQLGRETLQTCYVFPKFVALQIDSGNKGADEIFIRNLKKADDFQNACASQEWPLEIKLLENEHYVLGANDRYLFTRSADNYGNLGTVWIYNVETGKQIFEANFNIKKEFVVSSQNNILSLEFYKPLKLNCSLALPGKNCWQKIMKDNGIKTASISERPECSDIYKKMDFIKNPSVKRLPGAVQVFSKVRVSDIVNPTLIYLSAKSTCNETP
jgi:hypothetical protein